LPARSPDARAGRLVGIPHRVRSAAARRGSASGGGGSRVLPPPCAVYRHSPRKPTSQIAAFDVERGLHRLAGQHHLYPGSSTAAYRDYAWHPAVRRSPDRLDWSVGARRPGYRRGLLTAFAVIEAHARVPMFRLGLFPIRAFTAGCLATLLIAVARGGMHSC